MTRPLRVAVCLPQVPFERGGAEILAESLVAALRERGHEADLVTVPFRWYPDVQLLQSALAWRTLDLTEANGRPIDVVIAGKYPSYLVRHPRKVVWLVHQFRQAYDLHGTPLAQFADDARGAAMREAVRRMDAVALGEARAVLAISGNVAGRLAHYNGIAADVLVPPPQHLPVAPRADAGHLLSVGRLDAAKRVDLLLDAMALAPEARLEVAGDGPERAALEAHARRRGVDVRVRFHGRVGPGELAALYAGARAVLYAPHDEDLGFVAIEALRAGAPVVTTTDAGGPLELVRDGVTGLVVSPEAGALAAAARRLDADPDLARRLGEAGRRAAGGVSWDAVVARLVEAAGR